MQKFSGNIGVENRHMLLFSDFEHDGDMWTGEGPRQKRVEVKFSETYASVPSVMCYLTMWDFAKDTNSRMDIQAEDVTTEGFTVVFRTWGDTKVARVRVGWQAIGELADPELWRL